MQPGVVMSVLERDEMDRQLNNAKMELFAEQRRARETMESVQEVLSAIKALMIVQIAATSKCVEQLKH